MKSSSIYPPIEDMIKSGEILKEALLLSKSLVNVGVTTESIDKEVSSFIYGRGAFPAFLGYCGFPASCCISVNEEVVHRIPSNRILKDGDIVSIDCGVSYSGAITDSCRTYPVGNITDRARNLINICEDSLNRGISVIKSGIKVGCISYEIQKTAELAGLSVSREFVGHAVGYELHLDPAIPNFGVASRGEKIVKGMCLAIEPIVFDGNWKTISKGPWDVVSVDGSLSAHFEDTVVVLDNGCLVVTR